MNQTDTKQEVREGKCPVCKIKCIHYKGVRTKEPGYYCHRCSRWFNESGKWQPNWRWIKFDYQKDMTPPPQKRYSQEELDKTLQSSYQRGMEEGRQERELYKLGVKDERQRLVETLKKIGIVDDETGTITFSYNELFNIFKDLPSDKETIPKGYILNPVEDGVAKYIKKKLEIKKWDNDLCKIGEVVKEGE